MFSSEGRALTCNTKEEDEPLTRGRRVCAAYNFLKIVNELQHQGNESRGLSNFTIIFCTPS